jgi:iron(III) transport system permease protein
VIPFLFVRSFVGLAVLAAVGLPLGTLAYWTLQAGRAEPLRSAAASFGRSLMAAVPAAAVATLTALPTVYLADRYPSRLSAGLERTAALGYGIPPIALALGLVFFSLRGAPALYQSFGLLVAAYGIHFQALALGPIRSALAQAPRRIEEAARSLGYSGLRAVLFALFPALSRGIASSFVIVFVMAMKELPLTLLLAPTGYTTLAAAVFSRTNEGQYAEAAPFAAGIVLCAGLGAALVIRLEGRRHAPT